MQISYLQEVMNAALKRIKPFVPKTTLLDLFKCVAIIGDADGIRLSATDGSLSVILAVPGKVDEAGGICLPFETFAAMTALEAFERTDLKLDAVHQIAQTKCGSNKTNYKGVSISEFPGLTGRPALALGTVDAAAFARALEFAAGAPDPAKKHRGAPERLVRIQAEAAGVRIEATGFGRLHRVRIDGSNLPEVPTAFHFNVEAAEAIRKAIAKQGVVTLGFTPEGIGTGAAFYVEQDGLTACVAVKPHDPDDNTYLPDTFVQSGCGVIEPKAAASLIRRFDAYGIVALLVRDGVTSIYGQSFEDGDAHRVLPIAWETAPIWASSWTHKYLKDAFVGLGAYAPTATIQILTEEKDGIRIDKLALRSRTETSDVSVVIIGRSSDTLAEQNERDRILAAVPSLKTPELS